MKWLVALLLLFIFQIFTILIIEFRRPSKTVAWMFILFVFPIIGFIMYYFLAKEYSRRKKVKRHQLQYADEQGNQKEWTANGGITRESTAFEAFYKQKRLYNLLGRFPGAPFTWNNNVRVLTNAKSTYSAMLEAMEGAKQYIHFEIYTFRNDGIGRTFQELLIRKAKQGVKVRCIFDGIGSYELQDAFIEQFRRGGVEIYLFLPPLIAFFDKRMNYRNHRRIVVIDGHTGYLGGLNIGDEYRGGNPKLGFWRDTHLELIGDAVGRLQAVFARDWMFVSGQQVSEGLSENKADSPDGINRLGSPPQHGKPVQIISSGPDARQATILQMYFGAITCAQERIYIMTPYFIPDPSLRMALKTAAISGLEVIILFPLLSDSQAVHYASISYFEELMEAGVRFYVYQKGFMHAKVLIIDNMFASVGSANVDIRSFYSNFEINALLFDKEAVERLVDDFNNDLQDSEEWELEVFRRRPRLHKAKEIAARLLSPLF
ncbi:cardiolipin synthase [Paenibacillus agricola]|uniref:Cardiolipin synthase n=1 Tax=Paenibacillus agricola TaxID=2716264 RepID=A0ABX0J830_9BACL|nr:cardiolipin synthase [Paenibacillus agricola]NHN31956.1 cardiolipin synthase [Paenibacillus agricola]